MSKTYVGGVRAIKARFFLYLLSTDGLALRWFILYNPRYPDLAELLAHESVHIAQQKQHGLLKFIYLYFFDKIAKLTFEAQAFATSVKMGLNHQVATMRLSGKTYGNRYDYVCAYAAIDYFKKNPDVDYETAYNKMFDIYDFQVYRKNLTKAK